MVYKVTLLFLVIISTLQINSGVYGGNNGLIFSETKILTSSNSFKLDQSIIFHINKTDLIIENQIFDGISLSFENCPNAIVRNNTFTNTRVFALEVLNSSNIVIVENVFKPSFYLSHNTHKLHRSIFVEYSENVTVSDNIISNSAGFGISIQYSSRAQISNNYIENVFVSLGLFISNYAKISNNTIINTEEAIHHWFSDHGIIANNSISQVIGKGIFVDQGSDNTTIIDNNVDQITQNGIYLSDDIGPQYIINNRIANITDHGVYSITTKELEIRGNIFENIGQSGININVQPHRPSRGNNVVIIEMNKFVNIGMVDVEILLGLGEVSIVCNDNSWSRSVPPSCKKDTLNTGLYTRYQPEIIGILFVTGIVIIIIIGKNKVLIKDRFNQFLKKTE